MSRMVVAAVLTALGCSSAWAQSPENDEGFYLGAGVGQFNVNIDDIDDTDEAVETLDDEDTAWKAFGGWRMNPYFALELAYIDFGGPEDSFESSGSDGDFQVELSGFAPYFIASFPLGPVELFGKVGYYFYDVDITTDLPEIDSSSSDEDLLYGFGAGVTILQRLHARLEYEKVDSDIVDDADAIWLSGAWRF